MGTVLDVALFEVCGLTFEIWCKMTGGERHRGLFPFPVPAVDVPGDVADGCCRRVHRRLLARAHVDLWVKDIVVSLNAMFRGSGDQGSFVGDGRFTLSQALCLQRLRDAVLDVGKPPDDITGQEALQELRTRTGYTGEPVNLVPLDVEKLSLPAAGSEAASLETILQEEAESFVHRLFNKRSADGVVRERMEAAGLAAPYMDPILKNSGRVYAQFCKRLESAGVVEYHRSYVERVGAFAVAKKSGRQRLVIDARLANLHFEKPEKARLATGSTFARLEVDNGPPVEVGGVDIADAFYNISLPAGLRKLFALPGILARDVGVTVCEGQQVKPSTVVFPVLKVVPMGWSHALWVCQYAHEAVVNCNPHVDSQLRVVDKREVPKLKSYLHTEYVDNFVVLTQRKGLAYDLADRIGQALRERGLPTHEVEAGTGLETLGWKFSKDHPMVQVTPKRLWKLRLATQELLRVGRCDGRLLERLIGHYTFAGLLQRGFLSVFQASYVFVRKHYNQTVTIWPEVHREFFWACSLICLVRRDLSAVWSETVHATDASFWGRGVTSTHRDESDIRNVAAYCDRWRFSAEEEKAVCEAESLTAAQQLDPESLALPAEELGGIGNSDQVREVPLGFIGEDGIKVDSAKWDRVEGIPTLEGRSVVWLGQHLARSQKNLGRRHLVLTDSMSVTLSLTKGRSSTRSLNRVCRQMAAIELMSGMQFNYRWFPSELNPADFPSRAQTLESFSLLSGVQKLRDTHAAKSLSGRGASWRRSALQHYDQELSSRCSPQVGCQAPADSEGEPRGVEETRSQSDQSRASPTASWRSAADGGSRSEEFPRVPHGDAASLEELQKGLGRIHSMGSSCGTPHRKPGRPRHCLDQQAEPDVLRGSRPSRWSHSSSCSQVLPRRCDKSQPVAKECRGDEGLQKARASSGESAHAVADGVSSGAEAMERVQGGRIVDVDGVGNLLPPGGDLQAEEAPFGPSVQDEPLLGGDFEPRSGATWNRGGPQAQGRPSGCSSAGAAFESRRVGRGHLARPTLRSRAGQDHGRLCQAPRAPRQDLQHGSKEGHNSFQRSDHGRGVRQSGHQLLVSAPSRVCVYGRVRRIEEPHRGAETRKVASTEVSPPIQQRRSNLPGVCGVVRPTEGRRHGRGVMDVKDFRTWKSCRRFFKGIGLELFSGCGRFSRAIRKKMLHLFCVEVDIAHGPQFDLSSRRIQQEIFQLLQSKAVKYVWMGTPCNSWSRARRWDGRGPGPLRDDAAGLLGLPNLSGSDQRKVELGNALMRFSAKIFRMCMSLNIPVVLENPHTSRLWLAPPIRHLLHHSQTEYFATDFCQDGTPWRKRTGLLSFGLDLRYAVRRCAAAPGICSRTGLRHQHLEGIVNGQFRTLAAQPYPLGLCRRLATAFHHSCMRRCSAKIWEIIQGP